MRHEDQRAIWDAEHAKPRTLPQMDSTEPSGGVVRFWDFLKSENMSRSRGLEMGCGKGRNVIWLAARGVEMRGFDFSPHAIREAERRGAEVHAANAHFVVHDATKRWPYESGTFDFGIDCFAMTDIESARGRAFAASEMRRVLKPGALLLVYSLSTDDEFHKNMVKKSPAHERNSFVRSTGKFEKIFDEEELMELYGRFSLVQKKRIEKTTIFQGKSYECKHFWLVLRA